MANKQKQERLFGEYTLKRKLGVGGMATVYHAIHNKLQREVAIKIIHEHFVDDVTAIKRLEREAQIAKELKHPNIAPIITFNRVNNRPYLVMPYYAGKTLADYFYQPRAVTHDISLKILRKLAEGLDYAHSKGVIHRDFKLENILLDKNNQPAISDFGIAQVANTTRLTATGHFLGTPQYMAPEQASSAYDEVDYRVDLYAFGVMAYLMLTGVFPFTATDPIQLIMKHTTQAVPEPTLVNSELPRATDSVLIRALAKAPEYRFPSALDFAQSLEIALKNMSPITTLVDMQKLNPIEPSAQGAPVTRNFAEEASIAMPEDSTTRILDNPNQAPIDVIPAVQSTDDEPKKKRRALAFMWILLLFVLGGAGLTLLLGLGGNNPVSAFTALNAEATEESDMLLAESSEEVDNDAFTATSTLTGETLSDDITETVSASNTARLSSTPSATNTRRPTNTPSPTNTASPTKTPTLTRTVRPSNTPLPLPTNTFVPPPTSVPVQPTNVPNPPPSNNNPVQPVVEEVVQPVVQEVVAPVVEDVVAPVVEEVGCLLLIGC